MKEYYSVRKRSGVLMGVMASMDLENIVLSGRSQSQKTINV